VRALDATFLLLVFLFFSSVSFEDNGINFLLDLRAASGFLLPLEGFSSCGDGGLRGRAPAKARYFGRDNAALK